MELAQDVTTLGRLATSTIPLDDDKASRKHCKIEVAEDGYVLVDLESKNGTLVNGAAVSRCSLKNGDEIRIGRVAMVFQEGEPAELPPQSTEEIQLAPGEAKITGNFVLTIVGLSKEVKEFRLNKARIALGRNPANDIAIPDDEAASSSHAEILWEKGHWYLADLDSTNGTKVNGSRIERIRLVHEDEIKIGATRFVFRDMELVRQASAALPPTAEIPSSQAALGKLEQELEAEEGPPTGGRGVLVAGVAGVFALALLSFAGLHFLRRKPVENTATSGLVKNAGFEAVEPGGTAPEYWQAQGDKAVWKVDSTQRKQGQRSLLGELVADGESTCIYRISQPVAENKAYRLTGSAKAQGCNGVAGLRVSWLDSSVDPKLIMHSHSELVAGSLGWQQLSNTFLPPPWAKALRLSCVAAGRAGRVWFDDVQLEEVAPAKRAPSHSARHIGFHFDEHGLFTLLWNDEPVLWEGQLVLDVKLEDQETRARQRYSNPSRGYPQQQTASPQYEVRGQLYEVLASDWIDFAQTFSLRGDDATLKYVVTVPAKSSLTRIGVHFNCHEQRLARDLDLAGPAGFLSDAPSRLPALNAMVFGGGTQKLAVIYPEPVASVRENGPAGIVSFDQSVGLPEQDGRRTVSFAVNFSVSSQETKEQMDREIAAAREAEEQVSKEPRMRATALKLWQEVMAKYRYIRSAHQEATARIAAMQAEADQLQENARRAIAKARVTLRPDDLSQAERLFAALRGQYEGTDRAREADQVLSEIKQLKEDVTKRQRDRQAFSLLSRAQDHLKNKRSVLAKAQCEYIVATFPGSAAVPPAKRVLEEVARMEKQGE